MREPIGAVRVEDLWYSYREGDRLRPILQGVSFSVQAGESMALLGRSGSGKSTLLNLIGGIDTPQRGCIEVNGRVLAELKEPQRTLFRRRYLEFVYQFFNLISTLTVIENVMLPLELNGVAQRSAWERAAHMLERVELAERSEDFPEVPSGGEQQRIALARAVIHQAVGYFAFSGGYPEAGLHCNIDRSPRAWDVEQRSGDYRRHRTGSGTGAIGHTHHQ